MFKVFDFASTYERVVDFNSFTTAFAIKFAPSPVNPIPTFILFVFLFEYAFTSIESIFVDCVLST